jgi:sugar phosphate isomerase/epimerase
MLGTGELTQLEWVDLCANELNLDGVEFALAHFPRLDADYVAQLKKLCADRCLTVAGVQHDAPLRSDDVEHQTRALGRTLELACALGAPLVRFSTQDASGPPAVQWRELMYGLKAACARAKELNVTLALEPNAASPVASPADAKRALKECDSAWLRLGASVPNLASAQRDVWIEALENCVIVAAPLASLDTFGADESIDYLSALACLWRCRYRGFLTLEYSGLEAERPAVARAVAWLRSMLAKDALRDTVTS